MTNLQILTGLVIIAAILLIVQWRIIKSHTVDKNKSEK